MIAYKFECAHMSSLLSKHLTEGGVAVEARGYCRVHSYDSWYDSLARASESG